MTRAEQIRMVLATLDVDAPGCGRTPERHAALLEVARVNPLWVGRIVEAHLDAVAILAEAGLAPRPDALHGVWASRGSLRLDPGPGRAAGTGTGATASGVKPFCSGLGILDRALVTVRSVGGEVVADVDVRPADTLRVDLDGWGTPALAAAATGTLHLDGHPITRVVGPPGWYLARPGFWHGACGPASCWAGGAVGLVDVAEQMVDPDVHPHAAAHLGGMRAAAWTLRAVLAEAGRQIDAAPDDAQGARRRALAVRHTVERLATEIMDRFGRALGPRPYVADPAVAQRSADLHLYLRQDHAEQDLAALGAGASGTTPLSRPGRDPRL